jgi:hypothetical protein
MLADGKEKGMRFAFALAVIGLSLAFVPGAPAQAKTCKDVVTAKAQSRAQLSDASRERRARENAIANWSRRARDTYGWAYGYWSRAEEKQVTCGGGASSKHCTVSAKPCRLI